MAEVRSHEPAAVSTLFPVESPPAREDEFPSHPTLVALADLLWSRILECEAPEEITGLAEVLTGVLTKIGDPVRSRSFQGYPVPRDNE